ncbi:MAG: putative small secreted protein, partial [Cryomorphaceae bacterium]
MKRTFLKTLILFLATSVVLSSCEDVVELDLPEGEEFLV